MLCYNTTTMKNKEASKSKTENAYENGIFQWNWSVNGIKLHIHVWQV